MKIALAVFASLALIAPVAHAADQDDAATSCAGSTQDMVECLNARTAQWDKRMTAAYQTLMKKAEPSQHDQLRNAQRLWIQFRDANCLYYAMGEGTISRLDAAECLRSMTAARARELEAMAAH
ncbi:MAG TPA: lysozyme inhibitor LprI family protein [Nitrobacter sp.]|jgi:uncharacterized protein YecT (DUF1311 family)|nr:lysozyme inhibitor LprI family protein [Nitrobacter sp.]